MMRLRGKYLLQLAVILIILIRFSTSISLSQEKDGLTPEDILEHAQGNLDRSISILNTVATIMGVLVAVLTIVIAIVGLCGLFEINRWRKYREEAEKSSEEAKKSAKEAKEAFDEVKHIIDELRKITEEDISNFRQRLKQFPTSPEALSEEQKEMMDEIKGKYELFEAFGLPLNSGDYISRGNSLYSKGKYDLALKGYEKAIELKPDYAEAWDNKGAALSKLKRYEDALEAHEKAIELKPDLANAWFNKACLYALTGDKDNAIENLSKAIGLDAKYKEIAKSDEDFKNLWDDEDFQEIVS